MNKASSILQPKEQLNLFGYENYFDNFVRLYEGKLLPNVSLISGPKGLGKATFTYHFINYLLSMNEEKSYSIKNQSINVDNIGYKLVNANTHPNFFLVENNLNEKEIKIEQARSLINFLSKSTYLKDLKIVLIDNAEFLNINTSNALLKAIEEPTNNTFFFIIYNDSGLIPDTIKSRSIEYKIFLSKKQKINIFSKLVNLHNYNLSLHEFEEEFYFDTPGNKLKYLFFLNDAEFIDKNDMLKCIFYFIDLYHKNKSAEILSLASFLIEKFYNKICYPKKNNLSKIFFNRSKVLNLINGIKKFNLDDRNTLILTKDILLNETK